MADMLTKIPFPLGDFNFGVQFFGTRGFYLPYVIRCSWSVNGNLYFYAPECGMNGYLGIEDYIIVCSI